ncbi:MAG: RNA-directed DNA polymerase [Elusimicrobia bacterium]|nr:RNA-directed DNA polymerase [Elusimicrobiota bacterium]
MPNKLNFEYEIMCNYTFIMLCARKAETYVKKHYWFCDRAEVASFMGNLSNSCKELADELKDFNINKLQYTPLIIPKRKTISKKKKQDYTVRYLTNIQFREQVIWAALLTCIGDIFDSKYGDPNSDINSIKSKIYGNRLSLCWEYSKLLGNEEPVMVPGNRNIYRDYYEDYNNFIIETEKMFNENCQNSNHNICLLSSDISNFYPTINRETLFKIINDSLSVYSGSEGYIKLLRNLLLDNFEIENNNIKHNWLQNNKKKLGIPQGLISAGFLSNIYLNKFDENISNMEGLVFYSRYVDDFRVIIKHDNSRSGAIVLEKHFVFNKAKKYLSELSLKINPGKSTIIDVKCPTTKLVQGRVAERMETIRKRAYLPLIPEDARELQKDIEMLYSTKIPLPTVTKVNKTIYDNEEHILDGPGVREDSKKRFCAHKWLYIWNDQLNIDDNFGTGDNIDSFGKELIKHWMLEQNQQIQLMIGLILQRDTLVVDDINNGLEELINDNQWDWFFYNIAFLMDSCCSFNYWVQKTIKDHYINKVKTIYNYFKDKINTQNIPTYYRQKETIFKIWLEIYEGNYFVNSVAYGELFTDINDINNYYNFYVNLYHDKNKILSYLYEKILNKKKVSREENIIFYEKIYYDDAIDEKIKDKVLVLGYNAKIKQFSSFQTDVLKGKYRSNTEFVKLALNILKNLDANRNLPSYLKLFADDKFQISFKHDIKYLRKHGSGNWAYKVGKILLCAMTGKIKYIKGLPDSERLFINTKPEMLYHEGACLNYKLVRWVSRLCQLTGTLESRVAGDIDITDIKKAIKELEKEEAIISKLSNSEMGLSTIDISEIRDEQRGSADNEIRVGLCQIEPIFDVEKFEDNYNKILTDKQIIMKTRILLRRFLKIWQENDKVYLNSSMINKNKSFTNILVFPEIFIPHEAISDLKKYSKIYNLIIVGGLWYSEIKTLNRNKDYKNELLWIFPEPNIFKKDDRDSMYIKQNKLYPTSFEKKSLKIKEANPKTIYKINIKGIKNDVTICGVLCYDFTSVELKTLLKNNSDLLIVPSFNRDVHTFDNLAESSNYEMFSHVIVLNTGFYGGSSVRAPYYEVRDKRIFDIHGSKLSNIALRELRINEIKKGNGRKIKEKPAGFSIQG